jgi:hypothetical protein
VGFLGEAAEEALGRIEERLLTARTKALGEGGGLRKKAEGASWKGSWPSKKAP